MNLNLLPGISPKGTYQFDGADSHELYQKNLKELPSDWEWRNKDLTYIINSQGYRGYEWNSYDWNNSILVFGGSMVFGVGVDQTQTISSCIQSITDISCINLGLCASSVMAQWINTITVSKSKLTPKAVVYIWPQDCCVVEFTEQQILHEGPWNDRSRLGEAWIRNPYHSRMYHQYCIDCVNLIWKDISVVHFTTTPGQIDSVKLLPSPIDKARDFIKVGKNYMSHPGPKTLNDWAQIIVNDLQSYQE